MTKPASKVMSPNAGWWVGITPVYFGGWLANSQIETAEPTAIAIGPAQFV